MASSPEGALLTAAHTRGQRAVSASLTRDLLTLWRLFDPGDVDASAEALAPAERALVAQGRATSSGLASGYYSRFRVAEGATVAFTPVRPATLDAAAVETSLRVTGPVAFKRAIGAGQVPAMASRTALVSTSGAVTRMALDAGREVVVGSSVADPEASGWARVASGRACDFCAMLAGRGPVYSEESVDFDAHDHCGCSAEPAIGDGYEWPASSRRYSDLWAESTRGLSGSDARSAFRRAIESTPGG